MKKFRFLKDECMNIKFNNSKEFLVADDEFITNGFICLRKEFITRPKSIELVDIAQWFYWQNGEVNTCTLKEILKNILDAKFTQNAVFISDDGEIVRLDYPERKDGQKDIMIKSSDYKRLMAISEKICFKLAGYTPFDKLQIILDDKIIGVLNTL